jgi:hypothetical protein
MKMRNNFIIKLWQPKTPEATLDELREQMKKLTRVEISITTIWRALDSLGLS